MPLINYLFHLGPFHFQVTIRLFEIGTKWNIFLHEQVI
jgi:hypothetical protein